MAQQIDPILQVHPHVLAAWAKHGELNVFAIDNTTFLVESVSVVQTIHERKVNLHYLSDDGPRILRFTDPLIEDLGEDRFRIKSSKQSPTGGQPAVQAIIMHRMMPPAFLCPGCEACRH